MTDPHPTALALAAGRPRLGDRPVREPNAFRSQTGDGDDALGRPGPLGVRTTKGSWHDISSFGIARLGEPVTTSSKWRLKVLTAVLAASALLVAGVAQPAQAKKDPVFADGGVLAGSTNGISFAPDGTLWVANVFGATITQIDPENGDVLSQLTAADGVFFPDDVIVADDGTIYWTEIVLGLVYKKPVGEVAFPIAALNSANPLTLSDDGRLFAAGCYGGPDNSFVEIDPVNGGIVGTLFGPVDDCASNGMSWNDGYLYSPQPFLDSVLRVDPDTGATTEITTGWSVPIGTAFDDHGNLYALAQGVGEVVEIDIDGDPATNRTVLAEIPVGWADNIAVDETGRIFISSSTDSTIAEVLDTGELRIVVPGQFQMALGVSVIGDTVYDIHPGGVVSYDRKSGELLDHFRAPFGVSGFPLALSAVTWGDNLVLMSAFSGEITLWDPVNNVPITNGPVPLFPVDGQPFGDDLIVTTASPTGEIFRLDENLVPIGGPVASVPNATGIAAKDGDVYVSDNNGGTIVQIIDDGVDLATPVVVIEDLEAPEGIDIKGNVMYVVEGGSHTLTSIHLESGKRKTIATDLGLQTPLPFLFSYGYLNNVTVSDNNQVFVNADRRNVIYEF